MKEAPIALDIALRQIDALHLSPARGSHRLGTLQMFQDPDHGWRLSEHGEAGRGIEHITILIYRAPEALALALYLYEDLVQVPRVAEKTLSTL